ncbi:MAG: 16S rRNA (uracil(1498)-N(3))-methyltransferase [Bacillota bacterium]
MSRFFVKSTDVFPDSINITGEDVDHIRRVLRLKPGDNIIVSDSKGMDYLVEIQKFEDHSVLTKIVSSTKNVTEPPVEVTLFQGLPKSDKMDFIIQKGVELGVKRIFPVITERTVVKLASRKDEEKKCERWNRISMEAAKQCNRGIIPRVEFPISFQDAVEYSKNAHMAVIPYEKETGKGLRHILEGKADIKNVFVFIGPEGGFTEKEIEKAVGRGVNPVTLGPRILRTETAGIAVLSILMYELGDVGK